MLEEKLIASKNQASISVSNAEKTVATKKNAVLQLVRRLEEAAQRGDGVAPGGGPVPHG